MLRPDYVSMDNMTMKARRKKKERKNCRWKLVKNMEPYESQKMLINEMYVSNIMKSNLKDYWLIYTNI